jgi:catechol 2,3-dioxygenase-like lactoylglutathione lyase family enzyme
VHDATTDEVRPVTLRIGTVVLGVDDFRRALAFWTEALGYEPSRPVADDDDYTVLVPVGGVAGTHLALDTSESPVQDQPRVHLDLYADGRRAQRAEVDRLVALGASIVDWPRYPADPDFVVLADTEGNRFCIVDTVHGTDPGATA